MLLLSEIMRREPIEVAPEDTLGEVAERMSEANVGGVIFHQKYVNQLVRHSDSNTSLRK